MDDKLILAVSQVNTYIQEILDGDGILSSICIRGELSNYKKYPSGHHYFTLKDSESSLRCVMFRSSAQRLRFRPENGMQVLCAGRISVYPRDGVYQLYCISMRPEGSGDLSIAFEQLKKKLSAEGLFDPARKQPLPKFPKRIALITSPAGAAVHDMLRILRQRYPLAEVLLVPAAVQGEGAGRQIAAAIAAVNRYALSDLIITGRGGGSIEDLWAFNEEIVARAISASRIPIISAVGHEPDVTISDYVADLRAATPTNGAELAVPDRGELMGTIAQMKSRMTAAMGSRLTQGREKLGALLSREVMRSPLGSFHLQRMKLEQLRGSLVSAAGAGLQNRTLGLDSDRMRLLTAVCGRVSDEKHRLAVNLAMLDALSPLKVLLRGYAIASDSGGHVLSTVDAASPGDRISLRLSDGILACEVEEIEKNQQDRGSA